MPNDSGYLLEMHGVTKYFGDLAAVRSVDLNVRPGTVTCVVGPSGSGKSTLLRTVNLLESIDDGAIFLNGEQVGFENRKDHRVPVTSGRARQQRRNFGMVFQNFNLFPNLSALENVTIAPRLVKNIKSKTAAKAGKRILAEVGLEDKLHHYPSQLSGGQQQRVAIARALAMEPEIMLFDEPTSALDPELVGEVLLVMRKLAQNGSTMLVVTHEMRFAEDVADELIMMDAGRVVERGAPSDVIHSPQTERARKFFSTVGVG